MAKLGGIAEFIVDGGDAVTGGDATMGGADEWMPETPWSKAPVTGGNYRNYYTQSSQMQMMQILSLSMIIVVVLIVVVYMNLRRKARKFVHTIAEDLNSLKLAELGWVLYTRPGCPWCEKQLEVLGGTFPATLICGPGTDAAKRFPGAISCDDPKIVGFPFWYNTKTKESLTGMQSAATIAALARAPLPAKPCPPNNCAACTTKEICAACK